MNVSVSMSLYSHISKTAPKLHHDFDAYCLRPWVGLTLAALQYVIYFRLCGWRHIFTQWQGISDNFLRFYKSVTPKQALSRVTVSLTVYRVGQKKRGDRLITIILSNLNRLKKIFTERFRSKFVVKWILKNSIAPCICCYTTLWNINVSKTNH